MRNEEISREAQSLGRRYIHPQRRSVPEISGKLQKLICISVFRRYCICNGLGNPARSGGCRRQGRQFHWKNHSFSPFGANGPGLPGRVFLHVSNPFAPFSCLGKREKGNSSPHKKEA